MSQAISTPLWPTRIRGKRNVPKEGGAVIISNHQSFLDLVFIGQAVSREITYMARDTLWSSLLYRSLTWPFRLLKVRRGEADVGAIREAIERLRSGEMILLFPEGTRTRTGRIGAFTMGFYTMAHRAEVPIVPIRIRGSYEVWPRWQKLPTPGHITVDIFPPLDVSNRSKEEVAQYLKERVYS
jgi:1-acyl-sn-glycerol-3-phosphate acyltransferase